MNIGDTVRRTNCDNGIIGAKRGQTAVVIGFHPSAVFGSCPIVSYSGCFASYLVDSVHGELWFPENCEVIQTQNSEQSESQTMNIQEAYKVMQENCGIEVGDKVRILRKAKSYESGWGNTWETQMSDQVGKTDRVVDIKPWGIRLKTAGYDYPFFVLELVEKAPKTKTIKLNDRYTATVDRYSVEVGCQSFSFDAVEKLYEAVQDARKGA